MKKVFITSLILFVFMFSLMYLDNPVNAYDTEFCSNNNIHLTQEEAKKILLKYNNKVDYIYKGDASEYPSLKSKNLEGYVFLPNVPTDIGYFVDKNNGNIYFFHPSGYLKQVPIKE